MNAAQVDRRRRRAIALTFTCLATMSWAWQPTPDILFDRKDRIDRGDATLVARDRAFLQIVQERVGELKPAGKSNDEAVAAVVADIAPKCPEWGNPSRAAAVARAAYAAAR